MVACRGGRRSVLACIYRLWYGRVTSPPQSARCAEIYLLGFSEYRGCVPTVQQDESRSHTTLAGGGGGFRVLWDTCNIVQFVFVPCTVFMCALLTDGLKERDLCDGSWRANGYNTAGLGKGLCSLCGHSFAPSSNSRLRPWPTSNVQPESIVRNYKIIPPCVCRGGFPSFSL